MNSTKVIALIVAVSALFGCASASVSSGVEGGRFSPCPDSPNCVSTMDTSTTHAIEPITHAGSRDSAMAAVLQYLEAPNSESISVVETSVEYVHAVFTTRIMKFKDDVEFYLPDGEGTIHFRSASRLGKSDLGKNRERMEAFRAAITPALP
jgi:uncharacterized protein (DUF1499 family)